MIYKDYAEASNKLLLLYDANKPTSYIIYLEPNNLYQHLMMQLLPTEILNWVNHFILDDCSNDGLIDSFLEIDFDYSDQRDMQNDYLFLGWKIKVTEEMPSKYKLQIIEDNNIFIGKKKQTYSVCKELR